MKISEMADIASRVPFPLRVAMDRLGEKDPVFKKHIVGIDYAISNNMSDTTIRILIDDFLDYVEQKYFIDRNKANAKIVFFLADQRKK
jgi:hypothetical protein